MRLAARFLVTNARLVTITVTGITVSVVGYQSLLRFDNVIIVKDKYVKYENKETVYMITDTENRIYRFENSIWRLHWRRAEDWNNVDKNQRYRVKGVGIRSPFFGWYPHIYSVKKLD